MSDLIESLEAATDGSRELDAEIWLATEPGATRKQWSYVHKATGITCEVDETRDATGRLIIVPNYTTSLDAALTLVPEGATWLTRSNDALMTKGFANIYSRDPDFAWPTYARTPAIALCIAALRAREAGK